MSNIVQVLLYKKEQKLACLLTAYYELSLEDEAFINAVKRQYFDWLKYVWAFGKNYSGSRRQPDAVKVTINALLSFIGNVYVSDPNRGEECCK